ncbi:uncharacterized protein BDR25DRAFT_358561 [Lindgomyces ingoldianus]|uniref:Uncharacterized protein n=1 Tax=Lindgomyces ingoldianus TaxID=673940 RepID=A0ACB6QMT9_9PLEO|nr:uncharacterized protein BDR25DRAFT_358561 [Lindgomyces ingoldianus]KAF2467437.1 hypothetical protein BDR25DRAFT_358561 [Lindgomyces ingoldianus]
MPPVVVSILIERALQDLKEQNPPDFNLEVFLLVEKNTSNRFLPVTTKPTTNVAMAFLFRSNWPRTFDHVGNFGVYTRHDPAFESNNLTALVSVKLSPKGHLGNLTESCFLKNIQSRPDGIGTQVVLSLESVGHFSTQRLRHDYHLLQCQKRNLSRPWIQIANYREAMIYNPEQQTLSDTSPCCLLDVATNPDHHLLGSIHERRFKSNRSHLWSDDHRSCGKSAILFDDFFLSKLPRNVSLQLFQLIEKLPAGTHVCGCWNKSSGRPLNALNTELECKKTKVLDDHIQEVKTSERISMSSGSDSKHTPKIVSKYPSASVIELLEQGLHGGSSNKCFTSRHLNLDPGSDLITSSAAAVLAENRLSYRLLLRRSFLAISMSYNKNKTFSAPFLLLRSYHSFASSALEARSDFPDLAGGLAPSGLPTCDKTLSRSSPARSQLLRCFLLDLSSTIKEGISKPERKFLWRDPKPEDFGGKAYNKVHTLSDMRSNERRRTSNHPANTSRVLEIGSSTAAAFLTTCRRRKLPKSRNMRIWTKISGFHMPWTRSPEPQCYFQESPQTTNFLGFVMGGFALFPA